MARNPRSQHWVHRPSRNLRLRLFRILQEKWSERKPGMVEFRGPRRQGMRNPSRLLHQLPARLTSPKARHLHHQRRLCHCPTSQSPRSHRQEAHHPFPTFRSQYPRCHRPILPMSNIWSPRVRGTRRWTLIWLAAKLWQRRLTQCQPIRGLCLDLRQVSCQCLLDILKHRRLFRRSPSHQIRPSTSISHLCRLRL